MDLEDFIQHTLVSLSKGISKANEQFKSNIFILRPGSKDEQNGIEIEVNVVVSKA